jgi:DNA mismatch endonuclease (patch repair protein)
MADTVDRATRSRMMSGIRSKDTKPELLVRSALHRAGFRFRLHVRELPGHPDVVLPRWHVVVFVNGCFWHGHTCHFFRPPSTRTDFWRSKIERNRTNDTRAIAALLTQGWRVAIVWECALRSGAATREATLQRLAAWVPSPSASVELAA